MKGARLIVFLVLIVLIASGVFVASQGQQTDTPAQIETTQDNTQQQDQAEQTPAEPVTPDTSQTETVQKGIYTDYDQSLVANAKEGKVVIFFSAVWCSTCKILREDITANRSDIPDGLTILKADFDTATELKKKYGITYQHTLVQIDAEGNQLQKWSHSFSLADLVDQLI